MKRTQFTEEQIIAVLREAESGTPVKDLCRRAGISTVTFYRWKSKFEGMEISEMRRLRLLEDENARLKKKDCGSASAGYRRTQGGGVKKVVGPQAKREAVRVAYEEGQLSERRACGLIGLNRGSWRYRKRKRNEARLRSRLLELAAERPRFGYRRLHRMLQREAWIVNHKRVYRLYREEGLAMRRRKGKRWRAEARVPLVLPTRTNQMWTMDFTRDSLASGRKFRTLNLMDGYTREALWMEVDTSLPGLRVVQVLERVAQERGFPETIQVDNGPEFSSRVLDQWAYANGVALHFIDPGKPVQNAFIESFNGKFRDECLSQSWYTSLKDARQIIEAWRMDYNTVRPHSSLGYRTPAEYAVATRPAFSPTPVISTTPPLEQTDVQQPRSANL